MKELPHPACAAICKNAMNEICIEHCLPGGDLEDLEVRKDVTIEDINTHQNLEGLSWKGRFRLLEAKTDVLVDHVSGKGDIYVRP